MPAPGLLVGAVGSSRPTLVASVFNITRSILKAVNTSTARRHLVIYLDAGKKIFATRTT